MALLIAGILGVPGGVLAAPETSSSGGNALDTVAARRADVGEEATALKQAETALKAQQKALKKLLASIGKVPVSQSDVEKARIDMETAEVDAASAQMDLRAARHQVEALQTQISVAHDHVTKLQTVGDQDHQSLAAAQAELEQKQALLILEKQHADNLGRRITLAQRKAELARRSWQALQDAYRSEKALERRESLADLEKRLQKAQQAADEKAAALQAQQARISGDDTGAVARRHLLTIQIEQAMDEVFLLRTLQALEQARNEQQGLPVAVPDARAAPADLKRSVELLEGINKDLQPILDLIRRKQNLLAHEIDLLRRNDAIERAADEHQYHLAEDAFTSLIDRFQEQADTMAGLMNQVQRQRAAFDEAYRTASARSLTARQLLSRDPQAWERIGAELEHLPTTLVRIVVSVALDLRDALLKSDLPRWALLLAIEMLWVGLILMLGRLSSPSTQEFPRGQTFSAKARTVSLALLRSLRWTLLPGGALALAGWILQLPLQDLQFLLLLVAVVVSAHLTMGLSHWIFTSTLILPEKRQPTVHSGVVGITLAIAVLVLLDGIGRLGGLSADLWQLVERVLVILLLPLAALSLRLRRLLMAQVLEQWGDVFWVNLLGLASFAVPLVVLAASLVGLAGYINLAWFLAGRLGLILLVFVIWAILRHLVIDIAASLRTRAQTRPQRASLLTGGLIEPGQATLRLLLFFGAMWAIGLILGWSSGTGVGSALKVWLNHPLFSIGETSIDLLDIFGALIYLGITVYLGIWIRRLTFDWLYVRIRDQGLRNSLSVFTQYAIILLGILIGFNLLDVNLTSLTVFAGALGVGIGFGLQNIANNFVSGLILLTERPVRIQDWVTIGNREGRVSYIGIRSLTVTTWDNQDVIIPNADLISNPFTNWTLNDTLVRTIFVVGIHYQNDPHQAQQVILDAVAMQPEVSLERRPRVLLIEFNSSSVDFRVEFYTDVGQFARLEVKSKVMFAIWDALQDAGIGIPFPQQDIYIKELPGQPQKGPDPVPPAPAPSSSGAD